MTITDQPTTDTRPPIPADVLVDQLDDILASIRAHSEGLIEDLRTWGHLMLAAPGEPGHGRTLATRIQRGQQLLHEDGWWHVSDITVDETGVALHLLRAGHQSLSLLVDHDATFETAESF